MKYSLMALALAAALPLSAQANDLSYSYIDGGYARSSVAGESADGFFLDGSFKFSDDFYGALAYRKISENGASLDEKLATLGYRHPMTDTSDFIAELSYLNIGADAGSFGSDSANGYRVGAGFRGMLAPRFEGNIKAYYSKVKDLGGGKFGASIGGVFHINQTWGIVGSYDHAKLVGENINTWSVGVRASF